MGLYFGAGGIIHYFQTAIVTYIVTQYIRKRLDAEMEENPPVEVVNEHTFDDWGADSATAGSTGKTSRQTPVDPDAIELTTLRQRNAGQTTRPRK